MKNQDVIPILFGENLRAVRQSQKITQEDLADRVGVSRISLNAYERERRRPPLDVAVKIANILGVTLDELIIIKEG